MRYEEPSRIEVEAVKTRLKEQKIRHKKIVLDARKAFPEKRKCASAEIVIHVETLKNTSFLLESFQKRHFIDEDNVITPVGKVGRAIDMDFAIMELGNCIGLLERVKESLDFQSSASLPSSDETQEES